MYLYCMPSPNAHETSRRARAATSRRISGLELPSCFSEATVAAEARLLAIDPARRSEAQRRDLKRIASQAARLERGGL